MPSPARGPTQPQRVEMSNRRLVESAAELVAEKGWEATTAAEIGVRAGYSRTMVQARYGSKSAILDTFFSHEYVQRFPRARARRYLRARLVREYGRPQRKEGRNAARHSRTRRST